MKTKIAIVLTFIFTILIVSPTIISVVEKNFDVSVLFSVNEEENNQKKNSKNLEIKLLEIKTPLYSFKSYDKTILFNYYTNKYASIPLDNSSPPPEYI